MLKARLFLILMMLFSIAAYSYAQEEINIGDTVEGEDDNDPVEYTLFLEEDQSVEITLESDDFDTYLYILDEDGDEITHNDDYDGTNSYLVYTAEDSEPIIIQVASCCSGDGPQGDYELSVEEVVVEEEIDGGTIAYGDSVELDPSDTEEITFNFEGTEGDVITITVVSESSEDTAITLSDPDGDEVAYNNDDAGFSINPAIRRFELTSTGTYTIEIEAMYDATLFSPLTVSLEESDLLLVNNGPQTIEFEPEHVSDIMTFDVEEDVSYLLTVTLSEVSDSSLRVSILEEGETYALTTISITNTNTFAFVFTPEDSGRAHINIEFYTYDDEIEVTIQAEALQDQ
jgi:hypothetical protein